MSGFPLADLESHLLEKIITKCERRSYIRLQQTCHLMYDFVRNCKNISVCMSGFYSLSFENDKPFVHLTCYPFTKMNFDGFYGARISNLSIEEGFDDFENISNSIKKNQLTCGNLHLSRESWSKEQILAFLNVAKPVEVSLYSEGSDRYEALLNFNQLKEVFIYFRPEDVPLAIPKLLPAFSSVRIHTRQGPDPVKLLRSVLQLLQSQPDPHFDKFDFSADGELDWSADFVKNEFREFLEDVDEEEIDEEEEENEDTPLLDEEDSNEGVQNNEEGGNEEEVDEEGDAINGEQDEDESNDEDHEEDDDHLRVIRASLKLPEQYPEEGYGVVRLEAGYFLSVLYFGPRDFH